MSEGGVDVARALPLFLVHLIMQTADIIITTYKLSVLIYSNRAVYKFKCPQLASAALSQKYINEMGVIYHTTCSNRYANCPVTSIICFSD